MRISALILLFLPTCCVAQLEPVGCRSYEPAVVTLHGKLLRKTFAGPPNYQDIHKGDQAETFWVLNLDSPICVDEDAGNPDLNPGERGIRKVQLVLEPQDYQRLKRLLGRRVVARGSLFAAITGHHHTRVLLSTTYLGEPQWK